MELYSCWVETFHMTEREDYVSRIKYVYQQKMV